MTEADNLRGQLAALRMRAAEREVQLRQFARTLPTRHARRMMQELFPNDPMPMPSDPERELVAPAMIFCVALVCVLMLTGVIKL